MSPLSMAVPQNQLIFANMLSEYLMFKLIISSKFKSCIDSLLKLWNLWSIHCV